MFFSIYLHVVIQWGKLNDDIAERNKLVILLTWNGTRWKINSWNSFLKSFHRQVMFGSDAKYQQNFFWIVKCLRIFSPSVEFEEYDDYLDELVHASKSGIYLMYSWSKYLNRKYFKANYKSSRIYTYVSFKRYKRGWGINLYLRNSLSPTKQKGESTELTKI